MSLTTTSKANEFDRYEKEDFIYSIKSLFKKHIKNPSLSDKTYSIDDNVVYNDCSIRLKIRIILNNTPFKIKELNFSEPIKACILSNRDGSSQLVARVQMIASALGVKYNFNRVKEPQLLASQLQLKLFQELPAAIPLLEKEEPTHYLEELPDIEETRFESAKPCCSDDENENSENELNTPPSDDIDFEGRLPSKLRSCFSNDSSSDDEYETSNAGSTQQETSSEETLEELIRYIRKSQNLVGNRLIDDESDLVQRLNSFTLQNSPKEDSSSDEEMQDREEQEASIEPLSQRMDAALHNKENYFSIPKPNDEDCKIS